MASRWAPSTRRLDQLRRVYRVPAVVVGIVQGHQLPELVAAGQLPLTATESARIRGSRWLR